MKNIRFFAAAMVAFTLLSISEMNAQDNRQSWHDRMMSEKIAFLTTELDITPEEAQVFWPVYNQISQSRKESQKATMAAYKALTTALEDSTATEQQIDKLLDEYLSAQQAQKEDGKDDVKKFRKVLPGKKVAKLFVAEEKFRRQHIRSMKGGPHKPKAGRGK